MKKKIIYIFFFILILKISRHILNMYVICTFVHFKVYGKITNILWIFMKKPKKAAK